TPVIVSILAFFTSSMQRPPVVVQSYFSACPSSRDWFAQSYIHPISHGMPAPCPYRILHGSPGRIWPGVSFYTHSFSQPGRHIKFCYSGIQLSMVRVNRVSLEMIYYKVSL